MGYRGKNTKIISISTENWNILNERGKTSDSFNDVLDEIMKEAGIKAIMPKLEKS